MLKLLPNHRAFIDRFISVCQADDRLLAAFLGGSYANSSADEYSDLDLFIILSDEAFEDFSMHREEFLRRLGEPVFIEHFNISNMIFFIFSDGTEGELLFTQESQLSTINADSYIILFDKKEILNGVKFSYHAADRTEQVEKLRQQIYWFWHNLSHFLKAMERDQLWWAQGQLEQLRNHCINLARLKNDFNDPGIGDEPYFKIDTIIPVEQLAALIGTFGPMEKRALLEACFIVLNFYQELAIPLAKTHLIPYPEPLERILVERLEDLRKKLSQEPGDIDSFWEYSDPALSEARFRAALDSAEGDVRLELLTQIARTYSLRQQFDAAHEVLNEVEKQLGSAGERPRVRYLLERGRTFNSNGEKEKARSLFIEAWEAAQAAELEGLAVDAAHMAAITYTGSTEAIQWNQRGLAIARTSTDPKAAALIPAMLNNSAWDLHEMGRYQEALKLFEEAQSTWTVRGKQPQIRIAKWSVGRCLRSLGRYEDALFIQRALEAEFMQEESADGYVFEEIAENYAALGKIEEARSYFGKAFDELSKDEWFVKNEADRLKNLKARAESL